MWDTRIAKLFITIGCVGLSAVAVAGVMRVESAHARPRAATEIERARTTAPAPTVVALPAAPAQTTAKSTVMLASTTSVATAESERLSMPDFKGKRLSIARRDARKLGFRLVARTEDGDRVGSDVASYYRVRKQLVAAGTEIDPGSEIDVRVREIPEVGDGY